MICENIEKSIAAFENYGALAQANNIKALTALTQDDIENAIAALKIENAACINDKLIEETDLLYRMCDNLITETVRNRLYGVQNKDVLAKHEHETESLIVGLSQYLRYLSDRFKEVENIRKSVDEKVHG